MATKTTPIRVLIVEDSPVARELLVSILQSAPGLQVVGTARNGAEGVRLAKRLQPDVITMDAHMPEMDGFEATRQIMIEAPRPIVMVSASLDKSERNITFDALKSGALSVLAKPTVYDPPHVLDYLVSQLKLMSEVKVVRRWGTAPKPVAGPEPVIDPPVMKRNGRSKIRLVAVASSTGGPGILAQILGRLPVDFPVPIIIVQHITRGFGIGLAGWLNQQTALEVRLANHGDEPQAGQVLIAPDDHHLMVNTMGLIALNKEPPYHGLRPSADYLFKSAARAYGPTAIGIILTGMGSDGAEGLKLMRDTGAHTIAQDKGSSIVFGMPAVAIEMGAVEQILPPPKIAAAVQLLVQTNDRSKRL
jgi:two-component system chemotaxis response regulator CheB